MSDRFIVCRAKYDDSGSRRSGALVPLDHNWNNFTHELYTTDPPVNIMGAVEELRRDDRCEVIGKHRADELITWLMSLPRLASYNPIRVKHIKG